MPVLRVKESFSPAGSVHVYAAGALVDSDDPIVKGREHMFEAVEATVARQQQTPEQREAGVIESATAAPGEKRSRGKAEKSGN